MAKTWYPVIDYSVCIECGGCVSKCPHEVYDLDKAPSPVVIAPEACVDHCHGCGNRCPVGAITYVGDNTGWIPPNAQNEEEVACCSCGCDGDADKKVIVDYLFLDLKTCERCIETDNVLDDVMMVLTPAFQLAGFEVKYNKIEIATEELAIKYKFLSSPTIRVNGQDVCVSVKENSCGCCSDISGTDVECRVFEYNGESYEIPPKEMLADAILTVVFGKQASKNSCEKYVLPDKLSTFFAGKLKKQSCSCGGDCC